MGTLMESLTYKDCDVDISSKPFLFRRKESILHLHLSPYQFF